MKKATAKKWGKWAATLLLVVLVLGLLQRLLTP